MKKNFQREIKSPFSYQFDISEEGIYTLTFKALCKPGWRNKWWLKFKGIIEDILDLHLDDEDLRMEIDEMMFNKPKGKRGLFNSPAAFSGTKTLGKTKTVVFIISLVKGSHTIKFIPDGSPFLESIEIEKLDNPQKFISYLNTQAEDENYYSWYTFTIVNLPLTSLSVTVQAGTKEGEDDDDLKIFIGGEVQKNPQNRHQHSYFCGFSLKGKEDTFSQVLNLPKDIHYIELWADKTPFLKNIEIDLTEMLQKPIRIQKYRDNRYNKYDNDILKATGSWNTFFLKQKYPPPAPLDPNLVKAIIYVESRMGYGSSSAGYPAYPDIMQVGNPKDPALHVLNNDGKFPTEYEVYSGKVETVDYKGKAKVTTSYESIYWGVRWLYHKTQDVGVGEKQIWYSWEKAVYGYGPGKKEYTDVVWNLYSLSRIPRVLPVDEAKGNEPAEGEAFGYHGLCPW